MRDFNPAEGGQNLDGMLEEVLEDTDQLILEVSTENTSGASRTSQQRNRNVPNKNTTYTKEEMSRKLTSVISRGRLTPEAKSKRLAEFMISLHEDDDIALFWSLADDQFKHDIPAIETWVVSLSKDEVGSVLNSCQTSSNRTLKKSNQQLQIEALMKEVQSLKKNALLIKEGTTEMKANHVKRTVNMKNLQGTLPTFTGAENENFLEFRRDLNRFMNVNRNAVHNSDEKKAVLLSALSKDIQNDIIDAKWFDDKTYPEVVEKLKNRYWTERWIQYTNKLLHTIVMEEDEDIITFIRKFNNIVADASATENVDKLFLTAIAQTHYSEKIDLMISVKGREWAKSVKNLQNECRVIKAKSLRKKAIAQPTQVFYTPQEKGTPPPKTKLCTYCNKKGHTSDECRTKAREERERRPKRLPTTTSRDDAPRKKPKLTCH
jgi:hypothetical protein